MELYDQPANRFVASFIGSPAMNFLDGHIASLRGEEADVTLDAGFSTRLRLILAAEGAARGARHPVLGHFAIVESADAAQLSGVAEVVELLGSDTFIHLEAQSAPAGQLAPSRRRHPYLRAARPKLSVRFGGRSPCLKATPAAVQAADKAMMTEEENMNIDFNGRPILAVTGATGGIGGATVRRLIEHGADVVAAGRHKIGRFRNPGWRLRIAPPRFRSERKASPPR